ncbi:MAG: PorT family protein [Candidatus Eisenbacteria bacterium]|nr:PorT family protein [Candidatus Eisenbacteria bacterium]
METILSRTLRTWLCAILLLIVAPSLGRARIHAGVEAGLNLSSLRYDDQLPPWDPGWRTSFTGGACLEIPLRGRFALAAGLRYVQQGNRVKYDTGPGSLRQVGEFRVVQNYVSIPMLLKCRPLPSRRIILSVGPEIGFLLSGRLIVEETLITGGVPDERTEYDNIRDHLRKTNLTLDVGTGFEFPMENHVGVMSLRYTHGLTGTANKDAWFSDWKTRGIEWLVGMRW